MLSLNNAFDENEARAFDHRISEGLDESSIEYAVEPKFDGLAVTPRILKTGAMRGDGYTDPPSKNSREGPDCRKLSRQPYSLPQGVQLSSIVPSTLMEDMMRKPRDFDAELKALEDKARHWQRSNATGQLAPGITCAPGKSSAASAPGI